ncbi:hypothetical protein [uncultured Tenacibaculum sp.]|uniref:glycosyl-4,4'-diaponeurosporenoate acyltransferase CrtO family protein n=1 Tax=uncultured Tenacibaculum sp. TaxID=174713 RepID=UPI002605C9EC|nr:hypothetical protein [uncultured Tenacibaculum sp.]
MRKFTYLLWSLFSLGIAFLICYIFSFFQKYYPFDGFIFATQIHFLMMAWMAIVMDYLKVKEITVKYFESQSFEKDGRIYEWIGINFFRRLLVLVGWEKVTNRMNPIIKKDLNVLITREKNTKSGELAHLMIFIIILIVIPFITNSLEEAKWLLITNVIFHFYPVCLQRYNRPKYRKVISLMQNRRT